MWTFGYHSAWFGDFSVDAIIDEAAGMLLDAIKFHVYCHLSCHFLLFKVHYCLQNLLPTPLMFVAHSFGGIVVMKVVNHLSKKISSLIIFLVANDG